MIKSTVSYWMGELVADMSRERLIEVITELARENEHLRQRECDMSIINVRIMADAKRALLRL